MIESDYKVSPKVGTNDTRLLEVRASILFNFSFNLIADDIQSLMSLIKNSYDANASQKICATIKTQGLTGADTGDIAPEVNSLVTKLRFLNYEKSIRVT